MANQNAANIARTISNITGILVMCTEIVDGSSATTNPTAAQVNAVVNAAAAAGPLCPQLTYSRDGVTYNWTEYITMLMDALDKLRKLQIMFEGPYEVRTRPLI